MNTKELGDHGEALVCAHLRDQGFTILKTNWRTPFGQVDILAQRGDTEHIVEVKTSRQAIHHDQALSLRTPQLKRLSRVASWRCQQLKGRLGVSLDLVLVSLSPYGETDIRHFENITL